MHSQIGNWPRSTSTKPKHMVQGAFEFWARALTRRHAHSHPDENQCSCIYECMHACMFSPTQIHMHASWHPAITTNCAMGAPGRGQWASSSAPREPRDSQGHARRRNLRRCPHRIRPFLWQVVPACLQHLLWHLQFELAGHPPAATSPCSDTSTRPSWLGFRMLHVLTWCKLQAHSSVLACEPSFLLHKSLSPSLQSIPTLTSESPLPCQQIPLCGMHRGKYHQART